MSHTTTNIHLYIDYIYTEDQSFLDYSWKNLHKLIMWCTNCIINSCTKCHQNKPMDIWSCWCDQVLWLIKQIISWILWRYIFICMYWSRTLSDYVKSLKIYYGYYETDANRDQSRFGRWWFFLHLTAVAKWLAFL